MKNSKTQIIVASLAGLILSAVSPVFAQFHQGSSVTMGNSPIFSIDSSFGGYSAEHRAWLTQDRLDNALVVAGNKSPDAVTTDRMNGAWIVSLDGRKVGTASSEAEANEWSSAIKNFLSDGARTDAYLAALTGKNPVSANVAVIERKLYAPAGLAMKVRLTKDLNPAQLDSVELVEAVVVEDVPMGGFVIPANSIVVGDVCKDSNGHSIKFTSLRTPAGTEVPITVAINSEFLVTTESPKAVCTYVIPSGEANGMPDIIGRVPASVGIGTRSGTAGLRTALLLTPSDPVILSSQPMTLLFQEATPVAVVNRTSM